MSAQQVVYDPTITEEDYQSLDLAILITNSLSLIGALLMVTVVIISRYLGLKSSNRFHIKMSLWIGISDILFCIFSYFNVDDMFLCPTFTFITYFTNLWYVYISSAITLNLHFTFYKHHNSFNRKIKKILLNEPVLISLTLLLALCTSVPQYAISITKNVCVLFHLFEDKNINIIMLWLTVGFWENLCFIYTLIISFYIFFKIKKQSKKITGTSSQHIQFNQNFNINRISDAEIASTMPTDQVISFSRLHRRRESEVSTMSIELMQQINSIANRIIIYPLIPLITQSFYILINTYFLYKEVRTLIPLYFFYIVPYSAGFLNSILFFCLDPTLKELLKQFRNMNKQPDIQVNPLQDYKPFKPPLEKCFWSKSDSPSSNSMDINNLKHNVTINIETNSQLEHNNTDNNELDDNANNTSDIDPLYLRRHANFPTPLNLNSLKPI